jgi:hypothetical protein
VRMLPLTLTLSPLKTMGRGDRSRTHRRPHLTPPLTPPRQGEGDQSGARDGSTSPAPRPTAGTTPQVSSRHLLAPAKAGVPGTHRAGDGGDCWEVCSHNARSRTMTNGSSA